MVRAAQERTFTAVDGVEIFYRHWPSENQGSQTSNNKRAIILFHRGHEHSGRQQDVVDSLNMPEYDCFAWDARGLGKSPGVRGYAENFGIFIKDADVFAQMCIRDRNLSSSNLSVLLMRVCSVLSSG